MGERSPAGPGAVLLRWPTLLSLLVLLCNDHWWKAAYGNALTGKLSGVAALVLCPLVAVGGVEVLRGRTLTPRAAVRLAAWTGLGAALAIGLTETTAVGELAYEAGLGLLRWPLDQLVALAAGEGLVAPVQVQQFRDPTDLLTLPAAALPAWWLATSARRLPRRRSRDDVRLHGPHSLTNV